MTTWSKRTSRCRTSAPSFSFCISIFRQKPYRQLIGLIDSDFRSKCCFKIKTKKIKELAIDEVLINLCMTDLPTCWHLNSQGFQESVWDLDSALVARPNRHRSILRLCCGCHWLGVCSGVAFASRMHSLISRWSTGGYWVTHCSNSNTGSTSQIFWTK